MKRYTHKPTLIGLNTQTLHGPPPVVPCQSRSTAWVMGIIFKLVIAADCTCMAWQDAASLGISFGMSMGHTSNASSMQLYDNDMEYIKYIP